MQLVEKASEIKFFIGMPQLLMYCCAHSKVKVCSLLPSVSLLRYWEVLNSNTNNIIYYEQAFNISQACFYIQYVEKRENSQVFFLLYPKIYYWGIHYSLCPKNKPIFKMEWHLSKFVLWKYLNFNGLIRQTSKTQNSWIRGSHILPHSSE